MKKKYSTRDSFESVYLRSNCFSKALAAMSKEKVNSYLTSVEFNRCISFASRSIFSKNKVRLINCGFEEEDVRSITSVYGLEFMASKHGAETSKDVYSIMFRFIRQRWANFFIRLDIKFFNNERLNESYISAVPVPNDMDSIAERRGVFLTRESLLGQEDKELSLVANGQPDMFETHSYREQLFVLREELRETRVRRRNISSLDIKKREKEALSQKLLYSIRSLREKMSEIRGRIANEKKILKELKVELKTNTAKYSERLAFLATSKHTSLDIRKNAQKICRKYAINYIMWAQEHIEKKDVNPDHFISLK